MRVLRAIFLCSLMLVATTAVAKKEKDLICHVGNELSSIGETYMQNPDCTPPELWDTELDGEFICPDAGKIDLISVASANKHLNNPSHAFGNDSDYRPEDKFASGEGKEDSDDNGVDDGCEPIVCPCWPAGVSDATAVVDIVDSDRGPLTGVEATSYNAEDDIVHIVSFYSPGCNSSNCGALALSAFTVPDLPPNICGQHDAFDGAPPPSVQIQGMSDQEFNACLAVLEELAEQESCN